MKLTELLYVLSGWLVGTLLGIVAASVTFAVTKILLSFVL